MKKEDSSIEEQQNIIILENCAVILKIVFIVGIIVEIPLSIWFIFIDYKPVLFVYCSVSAGLSTLCKYLIPALIDNKALLLKNLCKLNIVEKNEYM